MGIVFRNEPFFLPERIKDFQLEEEKVDLSFRKRICPFLFNGVLCGKDKERFRHFASGSADGCLTFLHTFQQRTLHLRRSPVDLVRKNDIGTHRSDAGGELSRGGIIYPRSDDIRRQQVRRELQPRK